MKRTKKDISKGRQKHHRELADWNQKVKEFEYELRHCPKTDTEQKLSYCRIERDKSFKSLQNLSTPQNKWAKHGFVRLR